MVVLPGGGYVMHADHEGAPVAQWLAGLGIDAYVLNYRLAPHRHPAMLHDAQRAIRTLRASGDRLGIDPGRVGILGFSAGGHLAGHAATAFNSGNEESDDPVERFPCRPDAAVLVYAVAELTPPHYHGGSAANLLGPDHNSADASRLSLPALVSAETPPMFLVHSADDNVVPVENSLLMGMRLSEFSVPFEVHIFPSGGHGYGLAPGNAVLDRWPVLCATWLAGLGFVRSEM